MFRAALRGWPVAALLMVACSGQAQQSSPVVEYAEEVEQLIVMMDAAIDAHNSEAESGPPSLEKERARYDGWLAARDGFLEALRAIEPPAPFADLHVMAAVVVGELRDTTMVLADITRSADTLGESVAAWQGAPGDAYREADERAVDLCVEAQAVIDSGVGQAIEFASPWLQTSAAAPVDISVGCANAER